MATIPVVNIIDKRTGIISAVIFMILLLIYMWFLKFEFADPPPQPVVVEAETIFPEELILENLRVEGGAGAGEASDDEIKDPTPQTQQILTQTNSDTETHTGQSTHTNSPNSQNTPSTTEQNNNPFSNGGSGTGDDGGEGDKFGNDTGTGENGNGGGGSGIGRVRLNDPVIKGLQSNIDAVVHLKLTIDGQGNVISAYNIKAKTTTSNQILINKVIAAVKAQVKYNKDPGAPLAKVFMPVYIKAQ